MFNGQARATAHKHPGRVDIGRLSQSEPRKYLAGGFCMKINDITGSKNIPFKADTSRDIDSTRGEFGRFLEQELITESTAPTQGEAPVEIGDSISGIFSISSIAGLDSSETMTADTLDQTISRLENVEQRLQDGSATPKEIEEAIGSLSEKVKGLQETLQTLPEDHPLRQIGNELSVLTSVESVKWSRGEYL
jgi:hypothetical protein